MPNFPIFLSEARISRRYFPRPEKLPNFAIFSIFVALRFSSIQTAMKGLQNSECISSFFSRLKTNNNGGLSRLNINPENLDQILLQTFTSSFIFLPSRKNSNCSMFHSLMIYIFHKLVLHFFHLLRRDA